MLEFHSEKGFPGTSERVLIHTPEATNRKIREETFDHIREVEGADGKIDQRLRELEREWDLDRIMATACAGFVLTGVILGLGSRRVRRGRFLSFLGGGVLLQHALWGWSPALSFLRHCGFRTAREIETERMALKALRGDFSEVQGVGVADRAFGAALK